MNIWDWVLREVDESRKAGRHRLAELILRVPQLATDDEHSPLDAVMPEALALARAAKNPWLEVYFRHWNLQSRILHRLEVSGWMTEAAQLLDFAHSDEVRGCPQSVCVTQDFAACFGSVDGPAYVEERLAAASETLSRINAQWPCFTCISSERAAALLDGERPEEALAFLDRQEAALVAEGQGRQRHRFLNSRCAALLDLGRPEAALELLRNAGEAPDENERKERAIDEARVLAVLGRGEEGAALLPAFDRIRAAPNLYRQWAEAACALVKAFAYPNDSVLERTLLEMEDRLTSCGAVRKAFHTAHERARMALLRGARATALHACDRMGALLPKLRRPLGADAALAAIRAEAEALPPYRPVLPESPEGVNAWHLGDPEKALELLEAARARWPDNSRFVLAEADALQALGRRQDAEERLGGYLARSPEALDVLGRLAGLYLERKRLDALRARMTELLSRAKSPAARALALRYLAQAAFAEEGLEEAKAHLREQVALMPDDGETVLQLAVLERRTGELERALQRLDGLVAQLPDAGAYDWERMVVGTLLGRWDAVRDSAARVGFDVPEGDGPIDLDGGMCRVRLLEANGEHSDVYAERTGPVTARVVSVALPGYPQHIGDEVVFTAPALHEPPDEEAEAPPPLYPAVAVLRPGNQFVFALDGVRPTAGEWAELRGQLWSLGVRLSVRSDDHYMVAAPHDHTVGLPAVYALVAVPPDVELARVEAVLTEITRGWEHPVVWPGLLEKLGRQEKLAQHAEVMERYGIKP